MACGGLARPAVLMFGDTSYVEDADANERWEGWRHALLSLASKHEWRVAMVEVGCGGNVATVRHNSESLLEELIARGVDATLVRINPEMPLADDAQSCEERTIPILSRGLAALRRIDALASVPAHAPNGAQPDWRTFASPFTGFDLGGLRHVKAPPVPPEGGALPADAEAWSVFDAPASGEVEGRAEAEGSKGGASAAAASGADAAGLSCVRQAVRGEDAAAREQLQDMRALLMHADETINRTRSPAEGNIGAWERFAGGTLSLAARQSVSLAPLTAGARDAAQMADVMLGREEEDVD